MLNVIALLAAAIVIAQGHAPANADSPGCILLPQITESARVIVPATADPSGRGNVLVLAISPGFPGHVRQAYHFNAEGVDRSPIPLEIEGPLTRSEAEDRFGKLPVQIAGTYWVLSLPTPDARVDLVVTMRHYENGLDRIDPPGRPCSLLIRQELMVVKATRPSA